MKNRRCILAIRTLLCSAAFGVIADQPWLVYSSPSIGRGQAFDSKDPNERGYRNNSSNGADAGDTGANSGRIIQSSDQHDDPGACRVAVCISGHIRSFVHPVVHRSIRTNLVEAIENSGGGCQVDVFAYATPSDAVSQYKQVTKLAAAAVVLYGVCGAPITTGFDCKVVSAVDKCSRPLVS